MELTPKLIVFDSSDPDLQHRCRMQWLTLYKYQENNPVYYVGIVKGLDPHKSIKDSVDLWNHSLYNNLDRNCLVLCSKVLIQFQDLSREKEYVWKDKITNTKGVWRYFEYGFFF